MSLVKEIVTLGVLSVGGVGTYMTYDYLSRQKTQENSVNTEKDPSPEAEAEDTKTKNVPEQESDDSHKETDDDSDPSEKVM